MLYIANIVFFQWFFVRLTRCSRKVVTDVKPFEASVVECDDIGIGVQVKEYHTEQWFSLQGFIVPCTGWHRPFLRIGKSWFWRLAKPRRKK